MFYKQFGLLALYLFAQAAPNLGVFHAHAQAPGLAGPAASGVSAASADEGKSLNDWLLKTEHT